MRTACSRGQLANGGGLGGAVHGRSGRGRRRAAKKLAAAMLQGARGRSSGARHGYTSGSDRARGRGQPGTRQLGRTHVQNARSGRAQSVHANCSAKCQGMIGGFGEVGDLQVLVSVS